MTTLHRTLRTLAGQRPDLVVGVEGGTTAPLVGTAISQAGILLGSLICGQCQPSEEEAIKQARAAYERAGRHILACKKPGEAIGIGLSEGDTTHIALFAGERDALVVRVDFIIDAAIDLAFRNPLNETRIIVASNLLLHATDRPQMQLSIAPQQVREGADIGLNGNGEYILVPRRVMV